MQAWPNLQEVTVQPLTGGSGNKWNVGHKGHSSSDPKDYPHVNLPLDSGPFLIHFVITNPGNSVTFDTADPIWIQPGSKPNSHIVDPQIVAVVPSADGKELFVLDKNDNYPPPSPPQALYYKLNTKGHGPVDPIIDNGGTTRPPPPPPPPGLNANVGSPGEAVARQGIDWPYLITGLVIGLIIGLALAWLRRKS